MGTLPSLSSASRFAWTWTGRRRGWRFMGARLSTLFSASRLAGTCTARWRARLAVARLSSLCSAATLTRTGTTLWRRCPATLSSESFTAPLLWSVCGATRSVQVLGLGRTCLFAADPVQVAAAKVGKLGAARFCPVRLPGWLLLRARGRPPGSPLAVCLAQMVKAKHVPVVLLVSVLLLVASVLRQEAFLLLREAHDPVCLLDLVKLVVPQPPPEPLDSRQLLAGGRPRSASGSAGWRRNVLWDSQS